MRTYSDVTPLDELEAMAGGFENLEQASDVYLQACQASDFARFLASRVALRIREQMGTKGLGTLSQTTQKRVSTLKGEALVAEKEFLTQDRPTLTYAHVDILRRMDNEEAETWADKAVSEEWTPAQLRRAIAAEKRVPEDASTVVKKADTCSEKMKSLADQAAEVGALEEVAARAESVVRYVRDKMGVTDGTAA